MLVGKICIEVLFVEQETSIAEAARLNVDGLMEARTAKKKIIRAATDST